jgi:hypothetical protein
MHVCDYDGFIKYLGIGRLQMEREPVDSSVIASMGYSTAERILEIEYRSGEIYRYFEVPPEEYSAFRSAESKGTYLNHVFKARGYRYIRVQ